MRVISGRARGTKLNTIEGMDTRPTTDRVKEAIFSMIQSQIYDAKGLDLFAGSGALGIELLSRGGSECIFVEQSDKALKCIKGNLEKTHLEDQATLIGKPVTRFLKTLPKESVDIVFMDPPYNKGHIKTTFDEILRYEVLKINGIIVLEHHVEDREIDLISEAFQPITQKKYGIIGVTIFRRIQ